jgi:hypothetical protein
MSSWQRCSSARGLREHRAISDIHPHILDERRVRRLSPVQSQASRLDLKKEAARSVPEAIRRQAFALPHGGPSLFSMWAIPDAVCTWLDRPSVKRSRIECE